MNHSRLLQDTAALFAAIISLWSANVFAALVLTINSYNPGELSFTVSGTFDADVTGDQTDILAFKSDWSNNVGTNVDWIDDSVANGPLGSSALTVVENSILIGGLATQTFVTGEAGNPWGDSIFFGADTITGILAGTAVSGTLTVTGADLFDPLAGNFQLASGFDDTTLDWVRLEASAIAVPVPAAVWLFGFGLLGIIGIARPGKTD
jgi:hypothetical protein